MWIDSDGQLHRDTNSSYRRNVQPNTQPGRTYQNTVSGGNGGFKKWIIVIACIVGLLVLIGQCNTGQSSSSNTGQPSPPQPPRQEFMTVKSDALNVRAGPSADSGKIDKIYRENRVEIIERHSNGWVRINYGNGGTGYVNGEYLSR